MYKENKIIIYDSKIVRYTIEYSKSVKNIYIKLDDDFKIMVKANPNVNLQVIEDLLYKNIEKLNKIIDAKKNSSIYNLNTNKISIFGIVHNIYIEKSFKNETYKIFPSKIYLYLKDKKNMEKVIRRILKKLTEEYIVPRTLEISKIIKIEVNSVSVKWLTRTWGICNSTKKMVSFSSRLAVFEKAIIDYVIIHEICHLIEANHSKNFWNLVENFCPNFKELKNRLKDF